MSTTSSAPRSSNSARALLAVALLAAAARADVLHVPKDFPTVAEALAAAQAGDEVVLAAGTYVELVEIIDVDDIVLRGQGKVVLVGDGSFQAPLIVSLCDNVTVEHLTVKDSSGDAVVVGSCSGVTLRKVRVEGSGNAGIVVGQSSGVLVDRCTVEDAALDGIVLVDEDTTTVSRCTVANAAGIGISFDDTSHSTVERCKITDSGEQGILFGKFDPVTGCVAHKNVILDAGDFGIESVGTDSVLTDNRVQRATFGGIGLLPVSEGGVVRGNRLVDCQTGISATASGVLLQENRVVGSDEVGIGVDDDGGVLVDNRVIKAGGDAFGLASTMAFGSVIGCKALHAGLDGFAVDADGLTLTGNSSTGAAARGFRVQGTGNVFVGNSAKNSGEADLEDGTDANIYLDNDFKTINL